MKKSNAPREPLHKLTCNSCGKRDAFVPTSTVKWYCWECVYYGRAFKVMMKNKWSKKYE